MTYHIPAQYITISKPVGKGGVDNSFGLSGKHRLFDDFGQGTYPFFGELQGGMDCHGRGLEKVAGHKGWRFLGQLAPTGV